MMTLKQVKKAIKESKQIIMFKGLHGYDRSMFVVTKKSAITAINILIKKFGKDQKIRACWIHEQSKLFEIG